MNGDGAWVLIVTSVFYVSGLSWNTNTDALCDVRLISFFRLCLRVITFLIKSPPLFYVSII